MGEYAGLPSQAFWIWLQHGLGVGSVKPKRIYSFYSALQEFAEGGRKEWRLMGFLSQKEMDLLESYTPTDAARSMEYWEKRSIQVVAMADSAYPALLREIHAPPAVLYLQGRLPDFSASLNLAMVGTRNATVAGMRTARYFSRALARAGLVVVSGGARGIDSAAHLGALDAGGTTICVLGCGIGYSYLRENEAMRQEIARRGALVSEFPPDTPASKRTFPQRNRIIAGLCEGTLVVEAARKSGALITAQMAAEEGRDVFAIPGSIENPEAAGVNALIRDGATPVTSPEEILYEYRGKYPKRIADWDRAERKIRAEKNMVEFASANSQEKSAVLYLEFGTLPSGAPVSSSSGRDVSFRKSSLGPDKMQTGDTCPATGNTRSQGNAMSPAQTVDPALSQTAKMVLAAISHEKKYVDEICGQTGLPTGKVLSALLELELAGKIIQYSGKLYALS